MAFQMTQPLHSADKGCTQQVFPVPSGTEITYCQTPINHNKLCHAVYCDSDSNSIPSSTSTSPANLMQTGYVKAHRLQPTHIKITILDWDDTLCPTSHVFKKKCMQPLSSEQLQLLARNVYQLLLSCIQLNGINNVYIVTNGGNHWVTQSLILLSCKCRESSKTNMRDSNDAFLSLYNLLRSGIKVISAKDYYFTFQRARHQHNVSGTRTKFSATETMQWKLFTFHSILNGYLYPNYVQRISTSLSMLCVGDSLDEYVASMESKKVLQQQYKQHCTRIACHRVKLKLVPSFEDMFDQIIFLQSLINNDCFSACGKSSELDLDLEKEKQRFLQNSKDQTYGSNKQ